MNLPVEWTNLTRVRGARNKETTHPPGVLGKRKSTSSQRTPLNQDNRDMDVNLDNSISSICARISSNIRRCINSSSEPIKLDLEFILQNTCYKQLVESLFSESSGASAPSVPIITRSYEESFMREKIREDEDQCIMGEECECMMIDPEHRFVGVRFQLPNEDPSSLSHSGKLCVLCHRKYVQTIFYDILYSSRPFRGVVQRFGNICGKNEYAREDLLIIPVGGPVQVMPHPLCSHQRNKYKVTMRSGIKQIVQTLKIPSDFGNPS